MSEGELTEAFVVLVTVLDEEVDDEAVLRAYGPFDWDEAHAVGEQVHHASYLFRFGPPKVMRLRRWRGVTAETQAGWSDDPPPG